MAKLIPKITSKHEDVASYVGPRFLNYSPAVHRFHLTHGYVRLRYTTCEMTIIFMYKSRFNTILSLMYYSRDWYYQSKRNENFHIHVRIFLKCTNEPDQSLILLSYTSIGSLDWYLANLKCVSANSLRASLQRKSVTETSHSRFFTITTRGSVPAMPTAPLRCKRYLRKYVNSRVPWVAFRSIRKTKNEICE